jgi:4-hydroxyphenylpyruvate dioxygenase-like putative hemolysin
MRLDHIAYRVQDRDATVEYLENVLKYTQAEEFEITFSDNSKAMCVAMTPPEKPHSSQKFSVDFPAVGPTVTSYHLAPEIFISQGSKGSIVDTWVKETGGGIHHLAYSVQDIDAKVEEFRSLGVKFLSDEIIDCPEDNLRQIFTEPQTLLGGIIIELIERGDKGFCKGSVKNLMESTSTESKNKDGYEGMERPRL